MKKLGICLVFVLMLALLLTGCNDTPEQPSNDAPATDAPATDKNDPPATDTVEIPSLEELIEINDRLFGEAATDYKLAAELDDRRITVEDRLMQLYEEEEKGISIDN